MSLSQPPFKPCLARNLETTVGNHNSQSQKALTWRCLQICDGEKTSYACSKLAVTIRTSSTTTRDRNLQFRGAVSTGGSPLDFLIFFPVFMCNLVRQAPQNLESSEKSSGENRVKSCHFCGCHGFFGPENMLKKCR